MHPIIVSIQSPLVFRWNDLGCMNTRKVKCDPLRNPKTPQNTNIAGGRGRERGPELGRRTFIDNLVDRTNSSTRARYQETPIRRIPANHRVPASGSIVENTRAAAAPSNTSAEEDRVSTAGSADRDYLSN